MKDLVGFQSRGLDRLAELKGKLDEFGVLQFVVLDMSLARGVDYYTGIIFEIKGPSSDLGSIGAGGRYDNLISDICGSEVPAAGFSIGIDRVMMLSIDVCEASKPAIYVLPLVKSAVTLACQASTLLWDSGLKTVLSDITKATRGIQTATKQNAKYVILIGQNEVDDNTLTIKDLDARLQTNLPFKDLHKWSQLSNNINLSEATSN